MRLLSQIIPAAMLSLATTGFALADPPTATVAESENQLTLSWPAAETPNPPRGRLVLDLREGQPLLAELTLLAADDSVISRLLGVEPLAFVTVGTRVSPGGRPPEMSPFNVFFDSPADRPHETHATQRKRGAHHEHRQGRRLSVDLGALTAGPFAGHWRISVFDGSPLIQLEAILKTDREQTAFYYDLGLVPAGNAPLTLHWTDTEGRRQHLDVNPATRYREFSVRHRMIVAATDSGALSLFPPPHQYFFPRDYTDNLNHAWLGARPGGPTPRFGFGFRQAPRGGGHFSPWFNAPPGTEQHLGAFLLPAGSPDAAIAETLRFTRGDRYKDVPGYKTFTSHYHMAIAMAALGRKERNEPDSIPDFVRMFKDMNVRIVHLSEFHGDGHPRDDGETRLRELDAMFAECKRLSDAELLLLPGEEPNVHLGVSRPGQHPGHWVYLFPREVRWFMNREPAQPFVAPGPDGSPIYRVGNAEEMLRLLEEEHGLAWTAHPRVKASSWTPDAYRDAPYFTSDRWLGAAWKAMPADLSRPKLGERVLDLLDDMANWGSKKYVPGEVDIFTLNHTHELFGHMNINYVKLDRQPRYEESWQPILDALRAGRFFVTTGEVLIPRFTVGGKESGQELAISADAPIEIIAEIEGTFPLAFAEVISGDGKSVRRHRIDLSDQPAFAQQTLKLTPDLAGQRWARLEVWDVAANGAFTQPVWLAPAR